MCKKKLWLPTEQLNGQQSWEGKGLEEKLTSGEHNHRGEALARVCTQLGIDGTLGSNGDAGNEAQGSTENDAVEDGHLLEFDGSDRGGIRDNVDAGEIGVGGRGGDDS